MIGMWSIWSDLGEASKCWTTVTSQGAGKYLPSQLSRSHNSAGKFWFNCHILVCENDWKRRRWLVSYPDPTLQWGRGGLVYIEWSLGLADTAVLIFGVPIRFMAWDFSCDRYKCGRTIIILILHLSVRECVRTSAWAGGDKKTFDLTLTLPACASS